MRSTSLKWRDSAQRPTGLHLFPIGLEFGLMQCRHSRINRSAVLDWMFPTVNSPENANFPC
jgi:hypothetical protein